jgi:hypothetical protein
MMTTHAIENSPPLLPHSNIDPVLDPPGAVGQESRSKPPAPLPEEGGTPHSIPDFKGGYTTYPNGDVLTGKQYRPTGKDHFPWERPNVKEWEPNVRPSDGKTFPGGDKVRYPRPDEVPKNSPTPKKLEGDE